ncbi:predicted protein [Lichtheimia corymbifera JMRC:FSU:9682]|uniref:Uncharacterized protein n=1 Tax=Lichtheimia corymbifera JMRC:FSU:9682 TaxID=1263082 RepID=A0A068RYV8_9FUNG|nr:predicted protein [Lichtheimia corymbifera JMRC:FSU:9682]
MSIQFGVQEHFGDTRPEQLPVWRPVKTKDHYYLLLLPGFTPFCLSLCGLYTQTSKVRAVHCSYYHHYY